jgi:hypothetical protein
MDQQPPPEPPYEPLPPPPIDGPASPGNDPLPSSAPEPQARRRRRGRILVAGLVVFALLLAGGAAAAFLKMRGSGEQLLSKVPASSDVVFTAYLDPSAGQKANLFLLASRFPALGSRQQLTSDFNDALDQGLASAGLRHTDLSWVGDQVAFVLDVPASVGLDAVPAYALLVDTDDEGAAKATIQELRDSSDQPLSGGQWSDATIDGVDVSSNDQGAYAIFDGAAVAASSLDEMSDIIATAHGHQPALEGSSQLQTSTAGLPDGKLALLYINPTDLVGLLGQISADPTADLSTLRALTGVAMTVSAQPDGIALDMQAVYDPSKLSDEQKAQMDEVDHPNPLLSSIPADALAVISQEHLDTALKASVDRLQTTAPKVARMLEKLGVSGDAGLLTSLNGDFAFESAPEGTEMSPGAALVLGTKDPAAMQRAFDKLSRGLSSYAENSYSFGGGSGGFLGTTPAQFVSVSPFRHPSSRWVTNGYRGVTISSFKMDGFPDISYAVVDGQGIIGTSAAQVQRVVDTDQGGANISSSSAYTGAIASVPSSGGSVWVNIQGIVDLVRQMMPSEQRAAFDRDTLPNLAPLKALVVGSESDSSHQRVRVFLTIG